nr:SF [Cloning vector pTAP]
MGLRPVNRSYVSGFEFGSGGSMDEKTTGWRGGHVVEGLAGELEQLRARLEHHPQGQREPSGGASDYKDHDGDYKDHDIDYKDDDDK